MPARVLALIVKFMGDGMTIESLRSAIDTIRAAQYVEGSTDCVNNYLQRASFILDQVACGEKSETLLKTVEDHIQVAKRFVRVDS